MLIWGFNGKEGWELNEEYYYYYKQRGNAHAYVERMIGFYRVHVSYGGIKSVCDIEQRFETEWRAFKGAEHLLEYYQDKDQEAFYEDEYSPYNPNGYWRNVYYKKDDHS